MLYHVWQGPKYTPKVFHKMFTITEPECMYHLFFVLYISSLKNVQLIRPILSNLSFPRFRQNVLIFSKKLNFEKCQPIGPNSDETENIGAIDR